MCKSRAPLERSASESSEELEDSSSRKDASMDVFCSFRPVVSCGSPTQNVIISCKLVHEPCYKTKTSVFSQDEFSRIITSTLPLTGAKDVQITPSMPNVITFCIQPGILRNSMCPYPEEKSYEPEGTEATKCAVKNLSPPSA